MDYAKLFAAVLLSGVVLLMSGPRTAEAACYLNCRCADRTGIGTSRSYGPFNSTAACNAAVSNFTMQCKSGNQGHWFTATCSPGCFNCEPPAPPKNTSSARPGPAQTQQSSWDAYRKAQEAGKERQFEQDKGNLLHEIEGVEVSGSNEIKLMAPPSGGALDQAERANEQSRPDNLEGHTKDWTHSSPGKSSLSEAPPVPAPVAAESTDNISQLQRNLLQRLTTARRKLASQDKQIMRLEQAVQAEEAKKEEAPQKTPSGESAALIKARQALAKAKADRAKTASELTKLEKQEAAHAKEKETP